MSQYSTVERVGAVERLQAAVEAGVSPMASSTQSYTLRRSGKRPLFFEGSELCMAMSYVPGTAFWYEVNIYRTTAESFVVYVRLFTKREGENDLHRVLECETFEDVMHFLETYDAAEDVRVDVLADDESAPLSELVVRAMALRARIEDARRQFRGLVGQILFDLDS